MDFKPSNGFFDLCINVSDNNMAHLNDILLKLYQMGYRTVALNQILDESALNTDRKKKKKSEGNKELSNIVPSPIDVCKLNEEFKGRLCIVNRLTFICSDPCKTHTLAHCVMLKKYNLFAIAPSNQNMLQVACSQLNADLITIQSSTYGLKLTRKLYQQAVERGLCFEIQYADLLDLDTRRKAIYNSHLFHTYGKSRNVIISSGAKNINHIRNPYDIINLGFILGLDENKSKAAILNECQLLLLRAERRRCGKAVFTVIFTNEDEHSMEEDLPEGEYLNVKRKKK